MFPAKRFGRGHVAIAACAWCLSLSPAWAQFSGSGANSIYPGKAAVPNGLGGCRAWGVESENRPQRGQFLRDLQPHSRAMGQKDG